MKKILYLTTAIIFCASVIIALFFHSQSRSRAFNNPNPAVRLKAISAIPFNSRSDPPRELIAALQDEEADVRMVAADRLISYGPGAVGAVRPLIQALNDSHVCVRRQAADALGSIGFAAVPELIEALETGNVEVRKSAIRALMYHPYKENRKREPAELQMVIPALREAAKDPDKEVRTLAEKSLKKIDPEAGKKTRGKG